MSKDIKLPGIGMRIIKSAIEDLICMFVFIVLVIYTTVIINYSRTSKRAILNLPFAAVTL